MARIMAIDFGKKRVGVAVTDSLQIIATGLDTIPTPDVFQFLKKYFSEEEVETIVIGEPISMDGSFSSTHEMVMRFVKEIKKTFPDKKIDLQDERLTSFSAKRAILNSGAKKKKRRDKNLVDKIAAVIILQNYLEKTKYSF